MSGCDIPDCPKPHLAKGLCRMHYYRLQRTGTTDEAPPHERAICSVDGCPSVVKSKGLCNRHYQQVKNTGAVQPDDPRTPEERFWDNVDRSGGPLACHPWTGATLPSGYGRVRWRGRLRPAHVVAWEIVHGPVPDGLELDHRCRDPQVCRLGNDCPHRACCNPMPGVHMLPVTSEVNRSSERSSASAVAGVRNSEKTHCPDEHRYDEENTYVTPAGARRCRTCDRVKQAVRRKATPPQRPSRARGTRNYVRGEQVHTAKLTPAQIVSIRERYAAGGVRQRDLGAEFGVSQAQISLIVRGKSWSTSDN